MSLLFWIRFNPKMLFRPPNPNPASFLCDLFYKFQSPLLLSLVSLISTKKMWKTSGASFNIISIILNRKKVLFYTKALRYEQNTQEWKENSVRWEKFSTKIIKKTFFSPLFFISTSIVLSPCCHFYFNLFFYEKKYQLSFELFWCTWFF